MNTQSPPDGSKSWADVLEDFDQAVRIDAGIDLVPWLRCFSDESLWPAMTRELLRIGCEARGFDFPWLEKRFANAEESLATEKIQVEVLQLIAADETALGRRVYWADYERFGFDWEVLQLRGKDDCFCVGQTIGEYRLDERVGAGGFGVVHRARSMHKNPQQVAVKSLRRDRLHCQPAVECLRREADCLSQLRIRNVPRFMEWGEHDGIPYFSMEWIEGTPAAELVSGGSLDWRNAVKIAVSVARIVDAAHKSGHLHGDIKPSNVLITPAEEVYVVDWGSTRIEDWRRPENTPIAGTTMFRSNEVLLNLTVNDDLHEDIYALGVFLFYLVTGQTPPVQHVADPVAAAVWKLSWFTWFIEGNWPAAVPISVRDICRTVLTLSRDFQPVSAADFAGMCEEAAAEPQKRVPIPMRAELTSWQLGVEIGRCGATHSVLVSQIQELSIIAMNRVEQKERQWLTAEEQAFELLMSSQRIHLLMTRLLMSPASLPFDDDSLRVVLSERNLTTAKRFIDSAFNFLNACIDICRTAVKPKYFRQDLMRLGFATVLAASQPDGRFIWLRERRESQIPSEITKEFYDACRLAAPFDAMFHLAASLDYRVRRFLRWGLLSDSDEQVYGSPIGPRTFVAGSTDSTSAVTREGDRPEPNLPEE